MGIENEKRIMYKWFKIDELENSLIRSKAECIFFDEKLADKIDEIKNLGAVKIRLRSLKGVLDERKKDGNENNAFLDYNNNKRQKPYIFALFHAF